MSRSLESAQRKVEARNFDIRKQLLEYDDVANDQRKVIYQQRNELLETDDISKPFPPCARASSPTSSAPRAGRLVEEQWDMEGWSATLATELQIAAPVGQWFKDEPTLRRGNPRRIVKGPTRPIGQGRTGRRRTFHQFERNVMLQSLDSHWREHLAALDHLRQGIHLRGYAQKNPSRNTSAKPSSCSRPARSGAREVTRIVFTVQIRSPEDVEETAPHADVQNVSTSTPVLTRRGRRRRRGSHRAAEPGRRSAATIPALRFGQNTSTATAKLS